MTTPETSEAPVAASTNMKLEPGELETIRTLHKKVQELVQMIGQSEVQKQRYLASLSDLEDQGQATMNAVANRLGIAPGTMWRAAPDGTVIVLPQQPGAPAR